MIPHEPRLRADVVKKLTTRFSTCLSLAWLSLAALVGTLSACGRVPGQFEIVKNQVPEPGCLISPSEGAVYRGQGHLDLSLVDARSSSAYFVFPLIKNNLPGSSEGPDPNQIEVNSFAVDIGTSPQGRLPANVQALFDLLNEDPSATDYALLHYSLPWSVSIPSGGGLAPAGVAGFPVALAQRVLATGDIGLMPSMLVNIRIRVFGRTTTQEIESDPFDFPVHVCNGCLVANVLPCPYASAPANPGNECNVAQDNAVDCCSFNGNLVCPPIVSTAQ